VKINRWTLNTISSEQKEFLLKRAQADIASVTEIVKPIIEDVRKHGDNALKKYALKFDKAEIKGGLKATDTDFENAYKILEPEVIEAIHVCAKNVKIHHQQQMDRVEKQWLDEVAPGIYAGEKVSAIPSVGLYVPRGKGAFPSVMYMLCVPAVVAGVKNIVVCTPPTPDGGFDAASLVAADICGVRNVYKAGGAQAIAALAYGTQTIPKVTKVLGPGSPYVAAAKRVLADVLDPGMPAGPSEALILADETADAWNTALDLINEAEHGPDSASILVTTSERLADQVCEHLHKIVSGLPEPRKEYCETVFAKYGGVMVCETMDDAVGFCNEYAVEHLLLKVKNSMKVLDMLTESGEILIGDTTPIVLGNFGTGVNAVLPTGGNALTHSCTSVWSFLKRTSLSYANKAGYAALRKPVEILADYEGFTGHAEVLRQRNETAFKDMDLGLKSS
jgi:histidinol dehydrogenase